jgi:major type 1 subunit fimbrin (pilin)
MKRIKLASAMALAMGIAFAGSAGATNAGNITFTGSVNDPTCTVTGGFGTDKAATNFTVNLGAVDPGALPAGNVAGKADFEVDIGGSNCTSGRVASMSFDKSSTLIDSTTGALKNDKPGGAANVLVQLLDENGAAIQLANDDYKQDVRIQNNAATMKFSAQFLADGGDASAGVFETSVGYVVDYN